MTRTLRFFAVSASAILLVSCGDDASPDPVEQIVVAEPGASEMPGEASPASDVATDDLVEAGRKAFAVCSSCHSVDAADASGIGPNLAGVVGRKAGALDDFAYSTAMAQSGLVWDAAALDSFLTNPAKAVPGTKMLAGQVRDADARAGIIAYLAAPEQ